MKKIIIYSIVLLLFSTSCQNPSTEFNRFIYSFNKTQHESYAMYDVVGAAIIDEFVITNQFKKANREVILVINEDENYISLDGNVLLTTSSTFDRNDPTVDFTWEFNFEENAGTITIRQQKDKSGVKFITAVLFLGDDPGQILHLQPTLSDYQKTTRK